ncbi:MAG: TetR family transcriptional regulator [Oscillospiraceae bacterium]|nr:TetR family transcriptional regulator [Oscillospiraceae bacterium]
MPPKAKITREMILDAGLELIRQEGADALNVRRIAAELACSTQPVMYHFPKTEELKQELYTAADAHHSEYLMQFDPEKDDPMLAIGLRYIRFAAEERELFRFLMQSEHFRSQRMQDMTAMPELAPILEILQAEAQLTTQQSKQAFASLFYAVHGMASLLANNTIEFDPSYCSGILEQVFMGVIGFMKGEE